MHRCKIHAAKAFPITILDYGKVSAVYGKRNFYNEKSLRFLTIIVSWAFLMDLAWKFHRIWKINIFVLGNFHRRLFKIPLEGWKKRFWLFLWMLVNMRTKSCKLESDWIKEMLSKCWKETSTTYLSFKTTWHSIFQSFCVIWIIYSLSHIKHQCSTVRQEIECELCLETYFR